MRYLLPGFNTPYNLFLWIAGFMVFYELNTLSAQSNTIDSLQRVIASGADTTKVSAMRKLGKQYIANDSLVLAIDILTEGANYSKSIDFDKGTAKMYGLLGIAQDMNGNLEKSIKAYDEARIYHSKTPNPETALNYLDINTGVAYYFAGELGKALEYYLKAYKEAKRIDEPDHVAKLVNNIAVIYRRSKKYKEALSFYKESVTIKQSHDDQLGVATSYQNIGGLYSHLNKMDSSLFYLDKAKELYIEEGAPQKDIDYVDFVRADCLYNMDKFDRAFELINSFEKNNFSTLDKSVTMNAKIVLADLYEKRGQHEKSLSILNKLQNEIDDSNDIILLEQLHQGRAKSLIELGRYKSAVIDLQQSSILKDSINSEDRQKMETELQTKFSTLQKEEEIEKLTLQEEINDLKLTQQRKGLWLISSCLVLVSLLSFRLFRQKSKIEHQSAIISKTANEKDVLLREIHHRVKNNLQVISSLLAIQGRKVKDQKAKQAIREGRSRVHSMSLIHQNLYTKDNLTGIEMQPYVKKLSSHLLSTYQVESGHITIESQVDDITLDVETVVPIGLIINELMSNALKYAFPNGRDGVINIYLIEKDETLILTVKDNGIGLETDQQNSTSSSFGHSLIRAFKSKLDSEIKIDGKDGTKVTIEINNFRKVA